MADPPRVPSSPDLLAHEKALRRLARHLVGHEADAEDLLQETWLEALRHPPAGVERLQGWLRVILKRTWLRTQKRRRARKAREKRTLAAEKEAAPLSNRAAPGDLERRAQRAELEGLLETLPALQRRALFLRYFEERDVGEIAALEGVSESTVRTWLYRGIGRLRMRMDERNDGDRRRWIGALVFAFDLESPRTFVPPFPLRSSALVALGLVVSVLLVSLATRVFPRDAQPLVPTGQLVEERVADLPALDSRTPADREPIPVKLVGTPLTLPATGATAALRRSLRLRVLDRGLPLSGADIWVSDPGSRRVGKIVARTDEEGWAELEDVANRSWIRPQWDGVQWRQVHAASLRGEVHTIDVRTAGFLEGRVTDPLGRPASGALVRVCGSDHSDRPYLDEAGRLWLNEGIHETVADDTGRYRLRKPMSDWMRVVAIAHEGACDLRLVPSMTARTTRLELSTQRAAVATGSVLTPAGSHAVGATVELVAPPPFPVRRTSVDAAGRFVIAGLPPGKHTLRFAAADGSAAERSQRFRVGAAIECGPIQLARAPKPRSAAVDLDPSSSARLLALARGGTASLRLRFPENELRANADRGRVVLQDRWRRFSRSFDPRTAEDLHFDELPAGSFEVRLECPPFAHVQRTIELRPGEARVLFMPLQRGAPQLIRFAAPRALLEDEELEVTLSGREGEGSLLLPFERSEAVLSDTLLRRLKPASYHLEVRTSGGLSGSLAFRIENFERVERLVTLR